MNRIVLALFFIAIVIFGQLEVIRTATLSDVAILLLNIYILIFFGKRTKVARSEYLLWLLFIYQIISWFFIESDLDLFLYRLLRWSNVLFFCTVSARLLFVNKTREIYGIAVLLFSVILFAVIMERIYPFVDLRLERREFERNVGRVYAFYSEPSVLAAMIVFLYEIINQLNIKKWSLNLISFSATFMLIISSSLSGLIGALLINRKFIRTKYLVLFGVIIVLTFDYIIPEYYVKRVQGIVSNTDTSTLQRLVGSFEVLQFVENIWLGSGLGTEAQLAEKSFNGILNMTEHNAKINNAIAYITYENGFLGLIIMLGYVWKHRITSSIFLVTVYWFALNGAYFFGFFWFLRSILLIHESEKLTKV